MYWGRISLASADSACKTKSNTPLTQTFWCSWDTNTWKVRVQSEPIVMNAYEAWETRASEGSGTDIKTRPPTNLSPTRLKSSRRRRIARPSALIERACSQARTITLYCRLLLIEFKKIPVFQAKFHDVSCCYKTKTTKVLPLTRSQHLYQNLPWNKAAYLHQNIWHRVLIMAARIHSRPGTI